MDGLHSSVAIASATSSYPSPCTSQLSAVRLSPRSTACPVQTSSPAGLERVRSEDKSVQSLNNGTNS